MVNAIKIRGYAMVEMVKSQWLIGYGLLPVIMSDKYAESTGVKEEFYLLTEAGNYQVYRDSIGLYTGLNDSNGVEIYERDIIKVEGYDDEFYLVKFKNGSFYIGDYFAPVFINQFDFYHVVGNSYDNPELVQY